MRLFWEAIKANKFYDRHWLRDFRMIKPTFKMLCHETDPLVSPVIQSLQLQSHGSFLLQIVGFIR